MNTTLNKYNNLYQKIVQGSHHNHMFDEEYYADEDISNDIALQAILRNKKLCGPVLYTTTFGFKNNIQLQGQQSKISQTQKSFGAMSNKQQKNGAFTYDSLKQKIILKDIISDAASTIKAPVATRIVEYNLQSKQIKDTNIHDLINNLDYFSQFSIKELILNLSQNPLCDNGFVQLINHLPIFTTAELITINLENTHITDHSLRSLNRISGHFENLKEMQLLLKKTLITEKQSFTLVDTFNNNGIDLEVSCDFDKVNIYSSEVSQNAKQGVEMTQSNISNSSNVSNLSRANSKLQSKINDKITTQVFSTGSFSQTNIGSSEMNTNSFQQNFNKSSLGSNLGMSSSQISQSLQEEDVKRKSPEELAAEKNYEDGYGKGFKILMGLGYKVGKGLGKNDQGITEPVQPQNKSKFKENNQSKASMDYFESLSNKTQSQQGLSKMVKFEKKSTLIINQKPTDQDTEDDNTSPSTSSNSKIEQMELQKTSSQSKGSANIKQNNNLSPFNQYQGINMYGNPNQQQLLHQNISTSPFIGNNQQPQQQLLMSQQQQQQQMHNQMQMHQQQTPLNQYVAMQLHPSRMM
ncbi:G-patch domain protein (macronuclear) [Tetrahymena thermophila SB210]|uniref:G-patch domain protein n=1 Tax=Tetrahymena thermophila (strain SB210) TaxID=312017 RepID=I7MFL7_TETTS|nr:G-patch domain protein [Tetrahymena thermophila SB210]EAS00325.2 G-patch domain protein [Tetrahymena thermophila SB210]|eukprot:XP_001020570.2 G-patch domain protein [Tetrahymena thermophila SB210]